MGLLHVVKYLQTIPRFAAKEACRKACDHLDKDTRGFKHIIILPVDGAERSQHQSQRPEALVLYEALDESTESRAAFDIENLDGQLCEISITHDGEFASAVALVPSMRQDQSLSQLGQDGGPMKNVRPPRSLG